MIFVFLELYISVNGFFFLCDEVKRGTKVPYYTLAIFLL